MKSMTFRIAALALLATAELASLAEARIGRPLTPMSYAGVARRTTYRAADDVAIGAAGVAAATAVTAGAAMAYSADNYAAAAAAAPPAVCQPPAYPSTAYNAYGQPYTVCR